VYFYVFNMDNPVVGGLGEAQVALRRAIGAAFDVDREIALARNGQAVAAHSMNTPGTYGFDPALRTGATVHDRARARALLDLYGFVDRDGDGWRELPDGQPLRIELMTQSDQASRALDEVFKSSLDAIGLRVELKIGQWSENLKASRAGRFMMWRVGSLSSSPDGQSTLERVYGGSIGKANLARFKLPAVDALYERLQVLPDGPERQALFREANRLTVSYMPYRMTIHRILCDLTRPQVVGYRRPPFWVNWWHMVDVVAPGAATKAGATRK
jgi:ABC-type transport system substrate-binding protein